MEYSVLRWRILCLVCMAVVVSGSRSGGDGGRLGGWSPITNLNDSSLLDTARKGVTSLEATTNSLTTLKMMKILGGQSQVVSGINYRLNVQIGHTDCRRDPNVEPSRCKVVKYQNCTLQIWVQGWMNRSELTNHTCTKIKFAKLQVTEPWPGGVFKANVSDDSIKEAAKFAVDELGEKTNGQCTVVLRRTVDATQQVVSGMKYRIIIDVRVNSIQDNKQTSAQCLVEIWEQAWMTPKYRLLKHECNTNLIPSGGE
jgi:hypothetical protein